jgi:hypothetical protein
MEKWREIMTCNLDDEELFIINLLYSKRNLRSDAGYHSDKLNNLFKKKFNRDAKDIIKKLVNKGYLSPIGKSPPKYYICDIPRALSALDQHGYSVTQGRIRRL